MNKKFLLPVFASAAISVYNLPAFAQQGTWQTNVNDVINNVIKVLNSNTSFSYTFTRETKYHADNYYDKRSAFFYMQKYESSVIGLRYQTKEVTANTIFNGKQILRLDLKNLTIDSASVTQQSMKSNSFLYHSYAMLGQCLPIVLQDEGFSKSLSDTLIQGIQYWKVVFEKANSYFGLYSGLESFDKKINLRRPYELIADKRTFLPKFFISKYIRGNDGRDFVKMTYENVQINPATPSAKTWEYAAYSTKYKPFVPEIRKEEIKTGEQFPGFILTEYKPEQNLLAPFSKYKGKLVLLEFWFKACGPCMEAMPQYNGLQRSFPADSFQLITINVEDKKEDIAFFYKKYPPVFPMLYNGGKMFKELGFNGCPTALLINRDGIVIKKYEGFNIEKLKKDITVFLK
jgi:thiol-disulfide isomerase/thioredoxin